MFNKLSFSQVTLTNKTIPQATTWGIACEGFGVYFDEPTCPMPSLKMVPRGGIIPVNLNTR